MANQPATRRGHEFTETEIDRALTALALNTGNIDRARETLKLDATLTRIPSRAALHQWKHRHAERYDQIRTERRPSIEAAAINDYAAIVARTQQVVLEGIEQTATGLHDLDAKDASAAVKNLAIAGGVAADKLLVFTDRPNQITERRDPEQLLRALEGIVGTAEEIPDVALIDESEHSNVRELDAAPPKPGVGSVSATGSTSA